MDLRTKLIEKQKDRRLSDDDMARMLGITRPMFVMVKNGKAQLGTKVIRGIVRAFPEMIPEVLIFLREKADISHIGEIIATVK